MSCQVVAHASDRRHSPAERSECIKSGRERGHLRMAPAPLSFVQPIALERLMLKSHRQGWNNMRSGSKRTRHWWPEDLTAWVSHFVSQPFPGLPTSLSDDASWKYLPGNSPSLFGLSWMFFPTTSPSASPPLVVGHHAPLLSWDTKELLSRHTVNRCCCDTCYKSEILPDMMFSPTHRKEDKLLKPI